MPSLIAFHIPTKLRTLNSLPPISMEDYSMCRYYKGEKESPYQDQNKSMLWSYEQGWLNSRNNLQASEYMDSCVPEYIAYGLEDFMSNDGIPISLKALLFNRYCKWCSWSMASGVEGFKEFYKKYYT